MSQTHNRGWQQVDTVEWFFTEFEKNEIYIPHTSYIKGKFILKSKIRRAVTNCSSTCISFIFFSYLSYDNPLQVWECKRKLGIFPNITEKILPYSISSSSELGNVKCM